MTRGMECLADPQVHDFVAGALDGPSLAAADQHLDRCAECRELVNGARRALAGAAGDPSAEPLLLPPGTRVGRFEIEEVLGRGAMGVVYAARDPQLGRRVALKLLHADRAGDASGTLLAEAQTMAQVAHPTVVAIYDVGALADADGEVYVAMELVTGQTLRAWLDREPRPWRVVVETVLGAGRGLASAHRAGVCHRDFKPENVLIGDDGRPRVTDFGMARAAARPGGAVGDVARTQTSMAGTPAYMAPELFAGAPSSAASDQFSFCVSLFEALFGARPFEGADLDALLRAARAGAICWPDRRHVPATVRRILIKRRADVLADVRVGLT